MGNYYMRREQHKMTVGLAATAFPAPSKSFGNPEAIFVQTIQPNTGRIHIGTSSVLADYSTPAFIIPAGLADAMMPFVNDENVYAISDVAAQTLMITYLAEPV